MSGFLPYARGLAAPRISSPLDHLCRERSREYPQSQESIVALSKSAGLRLRNRSTAKRDCGLNAKIGFKALSAVLTIGRRSKKHVDWTVAIAIFSTIVTFSFIALYIFQDSGDF
jgi:hypothetical protein